MCFNTPGFVAVMLGSWRLGATLVPVNHKLQAPEVRYILEHSKAKVCVGDGALGALLGALSDQHRCLTTNATAQGPQDFDALCDAAPSTALDDEVAGEDSIAEILYTSGTAGRPKGCLHSHRNVVLTAITAALALSITRDEVTLLAMPIWHASPLNNWLNGTLYMGGTVVLMREYHPLNFLKTVQDERVTLYFGAPVFFARAAAGRSQLRRFRSVRASARGSTSGGPIGAELARKLAVVYRSETFFQVYGMTETGPVGTTLYPSEQVAKAEFDRPGRPARRRPARGARGWPGCATRRNRRDLAARRDPHAGLPRRPRGDQQGLLGPILFR